MRFITYLGITVLLTGCVANTTNYYPQTTQGWRGANINTLKARWGMPDSKITSPNGNVTYIYHTQTFKAYNAPTSPEIGVNVSREGRAVITTTPNTNNPWNRGSLSLVCTTVFEANPKGQITHVQSAGNGCYSGQNFGNRMSNPGSN